MATPCTCPARSQWPTRVRPIVVYTNNLSPLSVRSPSLHSHPLSRSHSHSHHSAFLIARRSSILVPIVFRATRLDANVRTLSTCLSSTSRNGCSSLGRTLHAIYVYLYTSALRSCFHYGCTCSSRCSFQCRLHRELSLVNSQALIL